MEDIQGLQKEGKLKEAEAILQNIANAYPDNIEALFSLGTNYAMMGCDGLATVLLRFCLALPSGEHDDNIWNNLGTCWRKLYLNDRAEHAFRRAWSISQRADIASNLSTLDVNEGEPEKGLPWARAAIELDPCHRHANWNMSLMLLELERWEQGFRQYAWGLATGDRQRKVYAAKPFVPWWNGSSLHGKRIVVTGEQGLGDELMFASQINELCDQAKQVIFDCHPRLEHLFRYSFRKWRAKNRLHIHPTRKRTDGKETWPKNYPRIDCKRSLADTPMYLRRQPEDFPRQVYLEAEPPLVNQFKRWIKLIRPGEPVRPVGIAWMGGRRQTRKDLRAIPLRELYPLCKAAKELDFTLIDVNYVDQSWEVKEALSEGLRIWQFPEIFQHERWECYRLNGQDYPDKFAAKEAAKITRASNENITHIPGPGFDFMDTAAFVQAIAELGGIIICVNSTMVHLCGALGAPCWSLTPKRPAWRYGLKSTRMQWYADHIFQFRQNDANTWDDVLRQVIGALFELAYNPNTKKFTEELHGRTDLASVRDAQ